MLRATAACHFSGSELPKLVPHWGVLYILTYKCASAPQRRAPFSRSQLQKWLRPLSVFCTFWLENVLRPTAACHFSFLCSTAASAPAALASLLFEHQEPRIIEKTQRDIPNIWRACTFFLVTLLACWSSFYWLHWLCYSAFQLSILSEVRLLNIPSIMIYKKY